MRATVRMLRKVLQCLSILCYCLLLLNNTELRIEKENRHRHEAIQQKAKARKQIRQLK